MRLLKEKIIKLLLLATTVLAASVILGILAVLLYYGMQAFREINPVRFLFGRVWNPDAYGEPEYGFLDTGENRYSDYYYYIVEADEINGVKYGPIKAEGLILDVRNSLGQNYPNPFNPSTVIPYSVGEIESNQKITISFFDVSGKIISTNELGEKTAGNYTFIWNPSISEKGKIPSGVYYCNLTIGKKRYSRKMILLR